uniref:YDG domain-containing protein n=1 Tax=Physcomitrium patens TaxID=3218 RepID=A0A7I4D1Z7_PHYPA
MKEAKVELSVDLPVDPRIVSSSVSEGLSNNRVAGSLHARNSSAGLTSLKRTHQGLEEALVVKRVKLESGARSSQKSLSDDVRNLAGPLRDIADRLKQHSILGGNGDQYNDDQNMDVGTGDGGHVVVDKKANSSVEPMEVNPNQQLTSVIDAHIERTNQSSLLKDREMDNGSCQNMVADGLNEGSKQASALANISESIGTQTRTDLSDLLNDLSADDSEDFDEDKSIQWRSAVKSEPGSSCQLERGSQLGSAVKFEPGNSSQLERSSQLGSTVKFEPGNSSPLERSPQLGSPVKFETGNSSPLERSSQLGSTVKLEVRSTRQVPDRDAGDNVGERPVLSSITTSGGFQHTLPSAPQTLDDVSVRDIKSSVVPPPTGTPSPGYEHNLGVPSDQSVPPARRPISDSLHCDGFQTLGTQAILHAKQAGTMLQNTVQGGKPTLGIALQFPPTNNTPDLATAGNIQPSGMVRDSQVQADQAVPRVSSHVRDGASSGEQVRSSHGGGPPTSTAVVPYCSGSANRISLGPFSMHTAQMTSGDGCTNILQNINGINEKHNSRQSQACPPNSADLSIGANKVEPNLYHSGSLGPQNYPVHNQLALVKQNYDTTVSTPRFEVARALQQYHNYIIKAKQDRAEQLSRRESTTNESVKEGYSRGLECRPDIVAYNELKKNKEDVNPGVLVGDLPGVEVGDKFTYRHQMAVVGLHRLPNVGIDYGYTFPDNTITATAIVLMPKAGYVDDVDNGDTILYTGQGGRLKRNQGAPFVCDQKLTKGNLALATNHDRKLPVRVIRGHSDLTNKSTSLLGYTYDGLYVITQYEYSTGMNGFKVYKFTMQRLDGQPPIPPCLPGCTAHSWNDAKGALSAQPLQVVAPVPMDEVDVKQICAPGEHVHASSSQNAPQT